MITDHIQGQKSLPYRPLPPIQTVFASAQPPETKAESLTDQQVENWRLHLLATVGPFALIMTREEIQKVRDGVQEMFAPLTERIGNRGTSVGQPSTSEDAVTASSQTPSASLAPVTLETGKTEEIALEAQ